MSTTPLWRAMLDASDRAIEGREFTDLAEADRLIASAHLRTITDWLEARGHFGAAFALQCEAPAHMTTCNNPTTEGTTRGDNSPIGGEADGPADSKIPQ
jgi:hypothetical protein